MDCITSVSEVIEFDFTNWREVPTTKKDSAKAKRSTFANYVHQKDASIACFVFDEAHLRGIPLYSVHDCFIAPACYATQLTHIYVDAFHSLINPFVEPSELLSD